MQHLKRASSMLAMLAALALVAPHTTFAQAVLEDLGHLGGGFSYPTAVSADGSAVVGYSDNGSNLEAFRWTAEDGMEGLGHLGGGYSVAYAVSADGSAVVGYSYTGSDHEAFRWTAEDGMEGLGHLGGGSSYVYIVSADGSAVVGYSYTGSGTTEAFRWTAEDGMEGLGHLGGGYSYPTGVSADGSAVVGYSYTGSNNEAFRWTAEDGMEGLGHLGGGYSYPTGVSADGSVVVGHSYTGSDYEAFRWTAEDGMEGLGDLGGDNTFAQAVSADGTVVVGYSYTGSGYEAFRWTAEDGMEGLGTFGHEHSILSSVSADGEVALGRLEVWDADTNEYRSVPAVWNSRDGWRPVDEMLGAEHGWQYLFGDILSADGRVIVGNGVNPEGQYHAWRLVLPDDNASPIIEFAGAAADEEAIPQADFVLECGRNGGARIFLSSAASDPDGDASELTYQWSVAENSGALLESPDSPETWGEFPLGLTTATLIVKDAHGGMAMADVRIEIRADGTRPAVSVLTTDLAVLWPPNNQMAEMHIWARASDNCTRPDRLVVFCEITSSQRDDSNGSGQFTGDVNGQDGSNPHQPVQIFLEYNENPDDPWYHAVVHLRAERDGNDKSGRVYSIGAFAMDLNQNLSDTRASCVVLVPHDQGKAAKPKK